VISIATSDDIQKDCRTRIHPYAGEVPGPEPVSLPALVASLDRKRLGQTLWAGEMLIRGAFDDKRQGGSRWRLLDDAVQLWDLNSVLLTLGDPRSTSSPNDPPNRASVLGRP